MYTKGRVKEKLKRTLVSILYTAVLFAELGEFFVLNTISHHHLSNEEETHTDNHFEVPTHLPESEKGLELCVGNKCKVIYKIESAGKHSTQLEVKTV